MKILKYNEFLNEAKKENVLNREYLEKLELDPKFQRAIKSYRNRRTNDKLTHFAAVLQVAQDYKIDAKELNGILSLHSAAKRKVNKMKKKVVDDNWKKYQEK